MKHKHLPIDLYTLKIVYQANVHYPIFEEFSKERIKDKKCKLQDQSSL